MTQKRGYSREFPTGGLRRRHKLEVDWVPPELWREAKAKAKQDGVSLRVMILRWLTKWVHGDGA